MSFGGSKLLTAGRGGALLTDREDVFQRAKVYCERGNQAFPLSELQCAVLPAQISKLAARNAQRQANATRLLQRWPAGNVLEPLHPHEPDNLPSYYKLGFKFHAPAFEPWSREQLIAALQAEGFPCDSGFRGFARRTANRCRHATALDHSRAAAEAAVLLHHPILLAAPNTMDLLATAVAKVVQYGRG